MFSRGKARGRTARQDDPGQYMQLWLVDDVKEALLSPIDEQEEVEFMINKLCNNVTLPATPEVRYLHIAEYFLL